MDTLPEETLQEIMEYLRHSDLKCFRLVCKKFYKASLTFRIVNRENFVYGVKNILLSLSRSPKYKFDDFMKISITERRFYHFHFVNTEITAAFREFVEKRAEDILSLKFEKCKIMYHPMNFCESINKCIKLISLELHDVSWPVCNHAATISLPTLETMDISRIPDDMFNVLMDTNVKNLHVSVDWHHLVVICEKDRLEDLKCVDLSVVRNDEQLMCLADGLNLTTIRIDCCDVTNQGFKYFVEKQRGLQIVAMTKNLKKLHLSFCNAINGFENDVSPLTFSANFNNLEELDLSWKNEWLSDSILETCFKLPSLRILNLTYCEGITYKSFVAMPKNFPCLEDLNMKGIQVDCDMLLSTVSALKRLCKLEIWVLGPITERLLNLLYENSDSLHRVDLAEGTFIRSWERKTFIDITKCVLDFDITLDEYDDEYE